MNNKKIIFGILLFCAISFIAYTFANPLENKDDGTLIQGSGTNNVNNPNKTNDQKDPLEDDNNEGQEPGLDLPQRVDDETNNSSTSQNTTVTRPSTTTSNQTATRPSVNNGGSSSTPGGTAAATSYYTATMKVVNGYSDKGSITVEKGKSAVFTITANNEYTLSGATVSGTGCSISGNTVTVNNMTSNVTCTVTLPAEPIYTTVSVIGDGVTLHQEGGKVTINGKLPAENIYNTVKLKVRFTAPKVFEDSVLRNTSLLMKQGGQTYGYSNLTGNGNNGTSKAYYEINITFKEGITKSYVIDWGNGRKIQYDLVFNVDIEETPEQEENND